MQFYEYQTHYQRTKKLFKFSGKKNDPFDWYTLNLPRLEKILRGTPRYANDLAMISAEQKWYAFGCPYFKIFPQIAKMMSEVSIEIPCNQLRLPYEVFAIHLPYNNDFIEKGGFRLKSLLVHQFDCLEGGKEFRLESGAHQAFQINYQLDGMWKGIPSDFHYTMSMSSQDGTLEQFFNNSWEWSTTEAEKHQDKGEYAPSKELVSRIMRLAVVTCFFGIDQHELVMPDFPRRKIEVRARQKGIGISDALKDLARESKKEKHWTIGNEIILPRPIVERKSTDPTSTHEISNAYLRRGHMRWQRCGPENKYVKYIFIHPQLCRPDLPMKDVTGYRIPD